MKSLLKSAMRFTQKSFGPIHTISISVGLFLWSIIFTAIFFTSCQKPANEIAGPSVTGNVKLVSTDNANASEVMNMYSGLSSKTAGPEHLFDRCPSIVIRFIELGIMSQNLYISPFQVYSNSIFFAL